MALTLDKVPDQILTYQQLKDALNQVGLFNEFFALQNAADNKDTAAYEALAGKFSQKQITGRAYVAGLMQIAGSSSWFLWAALALGSFFYFRRKRK